MAIKLDWKQSLDEEFKKSGSITFNEWENHRKTDDNWKVLITKNRPELTKSISNETVFYDTLLSRNVFNKRAVETFKQKSGRSAQVSAILDALHKRPFDSFLSFCDSLVTTKQMHIVLEYLTPEIPPSPAPVTESDAIMVEVQTVRPVSYDWRKLIRDNLVQLTMAIDPDSGLIGELRSRDVINEWSADTFMDPKGTSHRVARILDHVLLKRPDEDFVKLCDALRSNNQGHVVEKWLTPGGRDRTDIPSCRNPHLAATNVQLDESELRSLMLPHWKDFIVLNRNDIVDGLDPDEGVLNELVKYGVMNISVYEVIKEEQSKYARAESLLDHMRRRSDTDFAKFRMALKKHNQSHVIDDYLPFEVSSATDNKTKISVPDEDIASSKASSQVERSTGFQQKEESLPDILTSGRPGDYSSLLVTSKSNKPPMSDHTRVWNASTGSHGIAQQVSHSRSVSGNCDVAAEDELRCRAEQMEIESNEDIKGPTVIKRVGVKSCDMAFYNQHKLTAYPMSKRCRGKCYIINNEFFLGLSARKGTREDSKNIRELFTQLNFAVEEYKDKTADEMQSLITAISTDPSLSHDQCLVLFILSHGTVKNVGGKLKDCIFGVDGKFVTPELILSPLTDRQCPYLRGKPRVVFFQACRGEYFDRTDSAAPFGVEEYLEESTATDFAPDEAPSYSDFLIGYPTQSHYRSFRNTEHGSWYINALIKVFMRHVHCMGLCTMLNILNGNVSRWESQTESPQSSNKTQIANFVSSLRKSDVYFFPGIILDG